MRKELVCRRREHEVSEARFWDTARGGLTTCREHPLLAHGHTHHWPKAPPAGPADSWPWASVRHLASLQLKRPIAFSNLKGTLSWEGNLRRERR